MDKYKMLKDKLNIDKDDLIVYNDFFKLKTDKFINSNKKAKLILCTSINPTQFGEGKTTVAIGIVDALNKLNKKAVGAIREPSIGPVFGAKGGATGGGKSSLENDEKINLHFTGDMYAIELANNYISSIIDNHIYWKSNLNIDPNNVVWTRTSNLLDRSLRDVDTKISKNYSRHDSFSIAAASSIMSIMTLSSSKEDFISRINKALVAYSFDNKPITLNQLNITNDIIRILDDSFLPNIAFTKEGSPMFVHLGPFANISVGTNSVISTRIATYLSEYVVTEAGFGSDLGLEKYIDLINYYNDDLIPDCVILIISIRSLLAHNDFENNFNLLKSHINNIKLYNLNFVVAINLFSNDEEIYLSKLKQYLSENDIEFSIVTNYINGSDGCLEIANKLITKAENVFNYKKLVTLNDSIYEKIKKVAKNIYKTDNIVLNSESKKTMDFLEKDDERSKYPLCFVKSPNTLTGNDTDNIEVNKIEFNDSTKIILVYLNSVYLMPGLGKKGI